MAFIPGFGYRAEEMIGRSTTAIIPPELQADEPRILETIVRGERINHFETVRVAKSGKRIEVSLTVSPLTNENGKVVGAAKIARDITQDKKTRRALRISERLASVGRLAATIAHEINNPLEAATNLVYLARDSAISQDQRDLLAATEEELARISHLTKQTLGFYRETKGAERIRISPIVDQLISIFGARTRNKSVDIRREIRGDPEVYAVADEIHQLITNLLSNSIDAVTRGGQIRLRISAATEWNRKGRSGVRLTVADSGSGIPKAVRSELFEPVFYHEKRGRNRAGLVAVQRHRRKTSWFDPCEKQIGARKWMDGILRFSAVISTAIRRQRGCMSGTSVYQMRTSHATDLLRPFIVVVDDEKRIADTLALILDSKGYSAEAAHDGESALEICRHRIPDLVLSDVVMPGMSGIELAIAVSQQFRDCHILLFSGQADTAAILEDAKRQGYDFELIAKPLHPEDLVTKIKDLIGSPDARSRLA
jgi:PAS domain S-box-containing protein